MAVSLSSAWRVLCLFQSVSLLIVQDTHGHLQSYDDSQHFSILWTENGMSKEVIKEESVPEFDDVTLTISGSKYTCRSAPLHPEHGEESDEGMYKDDAEPDDLLKPLSHLCTRRMEMYWEYEFCYNRHIRQFHENKGNEKGKVTEYILGKYDKAAKLNYDSKKIKTWFYNGLYYPFHEISMSGGTVCDLTGKPRKSKVRFICVKELAFEFVHFSEVTTCEYLVVIATQYLCKNPLYRSDERPTQPIECYPVNSSPEKPMEQSMIEEEVNTLKKMFRAHTKEEFHPHVTSGKEKTSKGNPADERFVQRFVAGEHCLAGGHGWWKHEVCFGKHIKQFHVDSNGRTDIVLGTWDEKVHKAWYNKNKERLAKYKNKFVTHYYAKGDRCDETGKQRDVQLRFRCIMKPAINIYLQEPTTCKYILTLESSYFCSMIDNAVENGLFQS